MKILLIQLYQTGDVVLTSHIPREIVKIFPDAEVDFLTFEMNAPIIENNPYINEIITTRRDAGFKSFLSLMSKIRNKKYDALLDFHNNPRSGYISFLSGAKKRICYNETKRKMFYNRLTERMPGIAGQIKLSLLRPIVNDKNFDNKSYDYKPEIYPSPESILNAETVLTNFGIDENDFFVTMSPTHKRDTRRWKIEHFIDTAKYLTEKGAKIILTYGPGEIKYINQNVTQVPESVFLMPELGLRDFIALIGKAKLHIGNDSAPHHIATAQNVPTFIIRGSTNDGWIYGSDAHTSVELGMECQPCGKSKCKISDDVPCMRDLTFEKIKPELDRFIKLNSII